MNSIKRAFSYLAIFAITLSTLCPGATASAISHRGFGIEMPPALPEAKVGAEYSYQFFAEGGLMPLTWKIIQGELPAGLTLDSTGRLQGIPSQSRKDGYQFVLEVRDSSQSPQSYSQSFLLTVQAAPLRIVPNQSSAGSGFRITPVTGNQATLSGPNLTRMVAPITSSASKSNKENTAKATPTDNSNELAAPANQTEPPHPQHRLSGWLRPASLDEVFAKILGNPALTSNTAIRIKLCNIGFEDNCANGDARQAGREKVETLALLNWMLNPESAPNPSTNQAAQSPSLRTTLANPQYAAEEKRIRKIIQLLSGLRENVITVKVENKKGKIVATTTCNDSGRYEFTLDDNDKDKTKDDDDYYVLSTEADNYFTKKIVVLKGVDLEASLSIEDRPASLLTRAVVGYQQAGAASTAFEQSYFFDLFVSQALPFKQKIDPDFGESWRAWGAIRAVSAPQSDNVTIADLSANFVTKVSELKANEAARVFDYLGGVEFRLPGFKNRSLLPSFDRQTKQKFTLSLIASAGFITPTNPTEIEPKTYKISEAYRTRFKNEVGTGSGLLKGNELDGKDYVSFLPMDRDRFFRQYYAGIRMQTFFFNRHDVPIQRFPVQLDLQYGINEYVTSGRVRGGVLRLDGYFPLPYDSLNFINLFGTAIVRPVRSKIEKTLILEEVSGKFFDDKTAMLPVSQFNRDYYRVGIGIDFVSFVGKLLGNR
ncbi:MAG: putative Ig domain-containing protein [Blastocatellia bacterium]